MSRHLDQIFKQRDQEQAARERGTSKAPAVKSGGPGVRGSGAAQQPQTWTESQFPYEAAGIRFRDKEVAYRYGEHVAAAQSNAGNGTPSKISKPVKAADFPSVTDAWHAHVKQHTAACGGNPRLGMSAAVASNPSLHKFYLQEANAARQKS